MRITTICAATLALGFGLAAAPPALASCQSICKHVYDVCIDGGGTVAECEAERDQCLIDCAGPSVKDSRKTADRRVAQRCRPEEAAHTAASTARAAS